MSWNESLLLVVSMTNWSEIICPSILTLSLFFFAWRKFLKILVEQNKQW